MMKNKKWIAAACVVLAAAFILGITGVISFPADASVKKPDRLIGVLVTLDQPDPFNGESPVPDGYRFPASRVVKDHGPYEDDPDSRFVEVNYVFEGLKGMTLMNPELPLDGEASYGTTLADGGTSDVSTDITEQDGGRSVRLEGTVSYVLPDREQVFWFSKVYQQPDGSVYAVQADAMGVGPEHTAGSSMGMTLSEEQHWTESGKTVSEDIQVAFHIRFVNAPVRISLLQFGASDELISREAYGPGTVPESLSMLPDAEYLVVDTESVSAEGKTVHERAIYSRDDDSLNTLSCREDGICEKTYHEILWP